MEGGGCHREEPLRVEEEEEENNKEEEEGKVDKEEEDAEPLPASR